MEQNKLEKDGIYLLVNNKDNSIVEYEVWRITKTCYKLFNTKNKQYEYVLIDTFSDNFTVLERL